MSSRVRKHDSGCQKRKKKKRIEDLIQSQKGAIDKFFVKEAQVSVDNAPDVNFDATVTLDENVTEVNVIDIEATNNLDENANDDAIDVDANVSLDENANANDNSNDTTDNKTPNNVDDAFDVDDTFINFDIFDPRNWNRYLNSQLTNDGFNDWSHLSTKLKEHEISAEHVTHMTTWYDLRLRLEKNQTVDRVAQSQIETEKNHWTKVLVRIFSIVKFLAKHNLAFRGSNCKLYQNSNGKFLGLIEMLAEFDSVVQDHVQRITNDDVHVHYLGNRIQNESITLLAKRIKYEIINKVKEAKYVDVSSKTVRIEESFLGFLEVDNTTGQDNVRGQGYDNGSNMKGKHQGVQKKLLDLNPRAFYTSCASHSLNLTLCDIANTCGKARDFFGIIQRIYTIFANSTKRWQVFKDNVKGWTVKSLSTTRWESRIDSGYREKGFLEAIESAKKVAAELDIDPLFRQRREIRRKRHFDENSSDASEITSQSAKESFRVNYFLCVVDHAIASLRRRFEQYQEYENVFGFLFTSDKLRSLDNDCLKSSCINFEIALKNQDQSDVDGNDLYMELKLLQDFLPNQKMGPADILEYLKRINCFPNAIIAYRILLTIPVTVASAERSFSKLKLLKNYMRSTMTQERLNGLALIAIENSFLEKVNYNELIEDFVSKNGLPKDRNGPVNISV
ncbi:hypothetical protein OSB04_029115 [Centaurea solstitialis]|uniref:HAT C-terminal dimerisation domain-containing protein n=1 Tax=Centaurea solstitialis TaxID=347529 RepID=A0AA38SGZ0_9ASTR|nr:hypothetical protein OSB04_029115 [Centaurea solstitialis]